VTCLVEYVWIISPAQEARNVLHGLLG